MRTTSGQDPETDIGKKLDKFLGPEYISYRPGEAGKKLAYMEGHEVISRLNDVFGWNGWNSRVMSQTIDFQETGNNGKFNVGIAVTVRVTAWQGDGKEVYREDIGYGTMDNAPTRGKALEKAYKEGQTDALKRAARQFGRSTGGCVYGKEYLSRVKQVKAPAERIEFVENDLCRKPMNKRKRFLHGMDVAAVAASKDEFKEDEDERDFMQRMESHWVLEFR
ncbi:DNA repair protein rad52 [Xylographa vitiligo]|nr:DNA repair protein rad52 [Xylographa vitiligo]